MMRGYKQTDVGIIPEEWNVFALHQVCERISVGLATSVTQHYRKSGVPIVRNLNIKDGYFDGDDMLYVAGAFARANANKAARALDVLTVHTGVNLGDSCVLPKEYDHCQTFTTLITTPNAKFLDPYFLCLYMSSFGGKREMTRLQVGGGKGNLNTGDLKHYRVPVPPLLSEQRTIAQALSDVDARLGALDRLIAKKRDVKQAAKQQLLTGQTRLPSFHGEWDVKRLGEVFTISAGNSKSAFIVESGDYWICDMGSVSTDGRLIVSKPTNYRGDLLRTGDLIMPKDDIGGGKIIGKVGYIDANDTYVLGDHVYCLRALVGDPRFLGYAINSHQINCELRKKVIGSAQLGLGRTSVSDQEIQFPPFSEQTAIAEVLTDMDAELAALEQRREKTGALKQAMMQELLTGKTRLI